MTQWVVKRIENFSLLGAILFLCWGVTTDSAWQWLWLIIGGAFCGIHENRGE